MTLPSAPSTTVAGQSASGVGSAPEPGSSIPGSSNSSSAPKTTPKPSADSSGQTPPQAQSTPPPGASSTAAIGAIPKLLLGIGPEADNAQKTAYASQPSVRLLTSWYNGPANLGWMSGWRNGTVPRAYAAGYAMQLVVFTNDAPTQVATKYGAACGRPYPLSSRFLSDMTTLAQTFAGQASGPPLYVSMFAEFQTYPCVRGGWSADPTTTAYYEALIDQYQAAEAIFHRYAPNAKVALCWGGWQARTDEPGKGGGHSMFPHLAGVLKTSDFESFQAMQSDTNVNDIRDMTRILGQYGPVLLAYYKPDDRSQATFDADIHTVFTPDYLRGVAADGLFGFAFMDNANLTAEPATAAFLRQTATEFGRTAR